LRKARGMKNFQDKDEVSVWITCKFTMPPLVAVGFLDSCA